MEETISVTLPDDVADLVREQVESGAYSSASAVVSEALRLLRQRDRDERLAAIKAKIRLSLEEPNPGRPIDEVFDELERRHAERLKLAR